VAGYSCSTAPRCFSLRPCQARAGEEPGGYFQVENVDEAYKGLTARGYRFNEEPYDIPVGRLVTLNDPDGPPDRPSRSPRTGQPLRPPPHASSAACPDRAWPRYAWLRAAVAAGGGGRPGEGGEKAVSFSYPLG
jgi:glyoxalase/bleomycin resistance protein/dioxygenase superfamily protein